MSLGFGSLQWRLVSIFIILTIFLIIPVGLFLNRQVETQNYNSFKTAIERGFDNWSIRGDSTLEDMLEYLSVNKGRNAITEFAILDAYRSYTVINKESLNVEYSSDRYYNAGNSNGKLFLNEILGSDNFIAVLNGEIKGDKNKLVHINGRKYFDYARLVKLADGDYILYFRYDSEAWKETLAGFNRVILSSLLFSIIISLVLGYLLSKTITSPIIKMMHRARRIAAGEFDQTLEVMSEDEIGQLTRAFNFMAKNLKDTLMEISMEKNKIETIFNYMTDGVIAFNLKGEVIHINPASRKLLGEKEFNLNFNEFSEKYKLNIKLEDILYLETITSREVNISEGERILKAYFAVFTDESKKPEGIITVLHDITEQQKLDNMRREFVANVSHELKTPLTTIKSYTETLLDGDLEDKDTAERFLRVIDTEADRMTRLVKDLLQLSSLDNKQTKWNMKEVSFVDIVKSSVNRMEIEAKNKGHELECYVIGEIPPIKADKDRMEQVILNLLSNAIKYTPENGKISVYIGKTYTEVYAKVIDNGIGIPEEDLPRIFERFYRVDKARSREMGGTGLGLSIAKEITEAHGGTLTISSEVGKGTEVLLKLPAMRTLIEREESISLTGSM
ncbi:MAG: HAMP domain-containing protein [Firmicutes bacterium]|nr:HAMP domain-containing protein [Bacillota bacterium]